MNHISTRVLRGAIIFGAILMGSTLCGPVDASEALHDGELSFSLTPPSGFQKNPALVGATPDIVHAYVLGNPEDEDPDILLLIERMRGTIGRERLKASQMPSGFSGSLITVAWKGFELDGFEVPESVNGMEFVTYNVQVPLKREAIQLKLFGPAERKAELKSILTEVLSSLDGESNWIASVNESPVTASRQYGVVLLVIAIIAIIGGLVVLWLISRKSPRGTVLAIAVLVYIAGQSLSSIRVRELVMLCGILKMLGFAGGILGIIDIVRKRPTAENGGPSNKPDAGDS